jgi:hypothetical protein
MTRILVYIYSIGTADYVQFDNFRVGGTTYTPSAHGDGLVWSFYANKYKSRSPIFNPKLLGKYPPFRGV